jgi:hypothetical protein
MLMVVLQCANEFFIIKKKLFFLRLCFRISKFSFKHLSFFLILFFLAFCIMFPIVCMLLFQFSYEAPIYKSKNPSCCKFLPVSCWRHCLKTIKIDYFGRYAYLKPLKKYFRKNAEILESIL